MSAGRNNNFDLLRLIAALSVWYGHCYVFTGRPDPLTAHAAFMTFGEVGVAMFFVISGYFVTASYVHHDNVAIYFRNRALRILPPLAVVVALSVFVLGPLVTTLRIHEYFGQRDTWIYLKSVLIFPLHYELPGVFKTNPLHAVNGSLWTLKQEVRCYVVIALMGVGCILRPRIMGLLLLVLCGIRLYGIISMPSPQRLLGMKWNDLQLAVQLGSLFAAGALIYLAQGRIALGKKGFALACALMAVSLWLPFESGNFLFDMSFAYAVIYLGFLHLSWLTWQSANDYSYGIYLYSFPMQQLAIHLVGIEHFVLFMATSLALTIACAVASWHFIEKPVLRLKG